MKLLAIDTSSNACSVALQLGDDILEEHVDREREHTRILVPMIERLIDTGNVALGELDAVVLGNGPGSFIGMRIGASVAQGLCYGAGLGLVPVSSLAAVAAEAITEHGADNVLVAQDARMHEVYVGRYHRDADGLPALRGSEEICRIGELADPGDPGANYAAAGAAWQKFPGLMAANRRRITDVLEICVPRARHLLGVGAGVFRAQGAIAPESLVPAYIRVKVAERPPATG